MPLVDNAWYIDAGDGSTTGWWAVPVWNNNGGAGRAWTAGQIVRQSGTPTVGNERCFVCVVAGTGGTGADPLTVFTRGNKIADGTATWQEATGIAALNGDLTNTPNWTTIKNTAIVLGQVIKRNNGASYQICTTAGTAGNAAEPSFSDTAGTTTADNTVTWTSLGVVGGFTIWGAPHARWSNAGTTNWGQAGNWFYMSNTSVDTRAAALTLTFPGTMAAVSKTISCDKLAAPPQSANIATGAKIVTTGNNAINLTSSGLYAKGIEFNIGTGAVTAGIAVLCPGGDIVFDDCTLKKLGTSSNANAISVTPNTGQTGSCHWRNVTVQVSNTADSIAARDAVTFIWEGGSLVGATQPTAIFQNNAGFLRGGGPCSIIGVDFSLATNAALVGASSMEAHFSFDKCKLPSGWNQPTSNLTGESYVNVIDSDSSAGVTSAYRYQQNGSQSPETTIVRTGGASEDGTGVAMKIATASSANWAVPFYSLPIVVPNSATGSAITISFYGTGASIPTNAELWFEVGYSGDAASTKGSIATTGTADILATGSAYSSDGSTWGGGSAPFVMSATFTPQIKGPLTVTFKGAGASKTWYIDPKPAISGVSFTNVSGVGTGALLNERFNGLPASRVMLGM
jgi:hypothetical protein